MDVKSAFLNGFMIEVHFLAFALLLDLSNTLFMIEVHFLLLLLTQKKKKLQDFAWFNSDKPQFFYQNYMLGLYYTSTE
jgi:hypothetical protein